MIFEFLPTALTFLPTSAPQGHIQLQIMLDLSTIDPPHEGPLADTLATLRMQDMEAMNPSSTNSTSTASSTTSASSPVTMARMLAKGGKANIEAVEDAKRDEKGNTASFAFLLDPFLVPLTRLSVPQSSTFEALVQRIKKIPEIESLNAKDIRLWQCLYAGGGVG